MCVFVFIVAFLCLHHATAKRFKSPGERYYGHFEVSRLDENDCIKKCEADIKCYRATWLSGYCYLHGYNSLTGKDVTSIGYVCKAKCLKL